MTTEATIEPRPVKKRIARAVSALAVTACTLAGTTIGVSAEDGPLAPLDLFTFSEIGTPSPLRPGIASQTHFTMDIRPILAGPAGFAVIQEEADVYTVTEVTTGGTVTTTDLTATTSIEGFIRGLQLTEDHILAEVLELDGGFEITGATPFLVDRATGAVTPTAPGEDTEGASRLSLDGTILSSGATDPYWIEVVDGGLGDGREFDDPSFFPHQPVSVQSLDGRFVAVGGAYEDGEDFHYELRVDDTTDPDGVVTIEVPCEATPCEIVVDAISSRNGEASVFFTNYAAEGFFEVERVGGERFVADVSAGELEPSIAVELTSPNGRWAVGRQATSGEVDLDPTRLIVRDLDTGRQRTFDTDIDEDYVIEPLGLSDDGRTLRYTAEVPCESICVLRDTYFGTLRLAPVADVTRGPAEDQVLRLYRAVFGRIPDAGGFDFWVQRYRDGQPLVDIAAAFAEAPEFAARYGENPTDAELIGALYRNTLGRDGDADGVEFWLGRRAAGISVAELLVSFADSPENIERTGTRAPLSLAEGRVLRLYRAMLGRAPDSSGLAFWVGQYHAGVTLEEMARRFAGEPEFPALYGTNPTDAELVAAAYRNVLGRAGESSGVEYWNQRMADGLSVAGLFVAFADSEENVENTGTVR